MTLSRDERGRVYQVARHLLNPDGSDTGIASTSTSLLSAGSEVLKKTDAMGASTTATYDALSRPLVVTSPDGDTATVTYDGMSRPVSIQFSEVVPGSSTPLVRTGTRAYDVHGRLVQLNTLDASGSPLSPRTLRYNGRGELVEAVDPLGNSTHWARDGLGRVISFARDLHQGGVGTGVLTGAVVNTMAYDGDGLVLTRTDDNGGQTSYQYDALGRRTQVTLADGDMWAYVYDVASQLTSWIDPNGTSVSQSFDADGRVTARSITHAAGVMGSTVETWGWDALGRLVSCTDDDSTVLRSFDSLGRMASETAGGAAPPSTPTTSFGYDLAGRVTSLTYPDGFAIAREFDATGRLDKVKSNGTTLIDIDWCGRHIVRRLLGASALREDSTHDSFGRLVGLTWTNLGTSAVVRDYALSWDPSGHLRYEARADQQGTGDVFDYDSLGRTVDSRFGVPNPAAEVASPGSQPWRTHHAYALDGAQNRITDSRTQSGGTPVVTTYAHDTRNRYVTVGGTARTYSKKGELLADGTRSYSYDYRGRLIQVRQASAGTVLATYGWDPLSRQDRRTVQGGADERRYFADMTPIAVHELSGGGFRRCNLVPGGSGVGAAVAYMRDEADLNGNGNTTETLEVLLGQGHDGSLVFCANSAGVELEGYTYDDFGSVVTLAPTGAPRSTALVSAPFRFQGMTWDASVNLAFAGPRSYDPAVGRWQQPDPLGPWADVEALGCEHAAFGHGPTTFTDSAGLDSDEKEPDDPKRKIKDTGALPGRPDSSIGGGSIGDSSGWVLNGGVKHEQPIELQRLVGKIKAFKCTKIIVRRRATQRDYMAAFGVCDKIMIMAHGDPKQAPYLSLDGQMGPATRTSPPKDSKTTKVYASACYVGAKGGTGAKMKGWLNANGAKMKLYTLSSKKYARDGTIGLDTMFDYIIKQLTAIKKNDKLDKKGKCCVETTICVLFGHK